MLRISRDQLNILYYALLKLNESIADSLYWAQRFASEQKIVDKRLKYKIRDDRVLLQHCNGPLTL